MRLVLGYTVDELVQMQKLYVHYKNNHPKEIWDVIDFWDKIRPKNVNDCLKIRSAWAECFDADEFGMREMIRRYLNSNPYNKEDK